MITLALLNSGLQNCEHPPLSTAIHTLQAGFPLSRTFPVPRSIFTGPHRKPAMFKHSNKQQLRSPGEHCKLCQCGPGRNAGHESSFGIPATQKTYLMDTIMAIFVCINMSIWNQKPPWLAIPGFSKIKVIFQDFPGPGDFPIKIPALSRIFLWAWNVNRITWNNPWWWMTPSWSCNMDSNEYSVCISIFPCRSSGSSSLTSSFSVRIYQHIELSRALV